LPVFAGKQGAHVQRYGVIGDARDDRRFATAQTRSKRFGGTSRQSCGDQPGLDGRRRKRAAAERALAFDDP